MLEQINQRRRLLALDGGGIRGILTLSYLAHIEKILRNKFNISCLADYFDFIGGTSTGAIIAAGLAKGDSVAEIQKLYQQLAANIFKKRFWRFGLLTAKFEEAALIDALKEHFGDITFSDPCIKTGLMIMAKRWDSGSPWVIHNSKKGVYWKYTKDYVLREAIRASTAAPSYFRPEIIKVKDDQEGAFVDGGVTPHNNPALQLLLLTQLSGYGVQYSLGSDKLLLVSVGTGFRKETRNPRSWQNKLAMINGLTSLKMLIDDADALNRTLLQFLSLSPTAEQINKEIGSLDGDVLGGNPLLSYVRYNVNYEPEWLSKNIGISIDEKTARNLSALDNTKYLGLLDKIGTSAANYQVLDQHFF